MRPKIGALHPTGDVPIKRVNPINACARNQLRKGAMATSMPKPKTRSRYIRRMHKTAERLRGARELELRELEEFLHGATTEEVRASLMSLLPEGTPLCQTRVPAPSSPLR